MRKNWIGTGFVIGASLIAGLLLSQVWEQVLGQPVGFSAEPPPQIVLNQPALPKLCVDFVTLPTQPGVRVVTVVDTETKKIAVYHEDMATGGVKWLATRDIQPDLKFTQHNPLIPYPVDIIKRHREMEQSMGKN